MGLFLKEQCEDPISVPIFLHNLSPVVANIATYSDLDCIKFFVWDVTIINGYFFRLLDENGWRQDQEVLRIFWILVVIHV